MIDKSRRIPRITLNKIKILRFLRKKQYIKRNTYIIINYYKYDKSWAEGKSMRKGVTLIQEIKFIVYIKSKNKRLIGWGSGAVVIIFFN